MDGDGDSGVRKRLYLFAFSVGGERMSRGEEHENDYYLYTC